MQANNKANGRFLINEGQYTVDETQGKPFTEEVKNALLAQGVDPSMFDGASKIVENVWRKATSLDQNLTPETFAKEVWARVRDFTPSKLLSWRG